MPQKRVQDGRAELPSYAGNVPIRPGTACSTPGQEGRRGRGAAPCLPRPVGRGRRGQTDIPQSGPGLAFAPLPDSSHFGGPRGGLSERENEGNEGAAVRSQGELQRYQAAAHRPVAGADEEAEEHPCGGLFHGFYEAPAQVSLGLDLSVVVGVVKISPVEPLCFLFVCLLNQCFLRG